MTPEQIYAQFERDLQQDPEFGGYLMTVANLAGAVLRDRRQVVRVLDRFVSLYGRSRGYTVNLEELQ